MKTITLALAAVFLFSACSTLPPEPQLTQEQIKENRDNLSEAFKYFANKRIVIVDGDSSFEEFQIRPLSDGGSADFIFYNAKKNNEYKHTFTNCRGNVELESRFGYLNCDLLYENSIKRQGVIYLSIYQMDYTLKDRRIIPTHKTVNVKEGDMVLEVSIKEWYTEFAKIDFKN